MSMMDCKIHGWWEVNGQDVCPSCEIIRLGAHAKAVVEAAQGLLAFIRSSFPEYFKEGGQGFTCPHYQDLERALDAWEEKRP